MEALGDSKLEQRELGGSMLGWRRVDDSKLRQRELGGSGLKQLQVFRRGSRVRVLRLHRRIRISYYVLFRTRSTKIAANSLAK